MRRFLYIGFLALLSLGSVAAQTPSPTPAEITEKEKAEIREFTKDFLGGLRKTRDVRPLVPKYFAKDFETFIYHFMLAESSKRRSVRLPNPLLRKRSAIAMLNYMSVFAPYTVLSLDVEKELPPRLRRQFGRLNDALEKFSDDDVGLPDAWLPDKRVLPQMESLNRAMAARLRSHPVETTEKYKAGLGKREKIDHYNCSILEDVPDRDSDNAAAQWLRSQPDAKTYMVGTPVGLAVGIIGSRGKYKVLYVHPWPFSYDGQLD